MLHELKTLPHFFEATWKGQKLYEYRYNDRNFQVGDTLRLRELADVGIYTGREIVATVTHILEDVAAVGLPEGYCVMGIRVDYGRLQ